MSIVNFDENSLPKAVWNPVTGCVPVSPGCDNCKVKWTIQNLSRFPAHRAKYVNQMRPTTHWSLLRKEGSSLFIERAQRRLSRDGTPPALKLFPIGTMGDIYSPGISEQALDFMFARLQGGRQIAWNLSKHVDGMVAYWARRTPPRNFWQGVSVETPDFLPRVGQLCSISFTKKILAIEPILAPFPPERLEPYLRKIDWLQIGGEVSHALVKGAPQPRPYRLEWVEDIIRLAHSLGVPIMVTALGGYMKSGKYGKKAQYIDGKKALVMGRVWREAPDPNDQVFDFSSAA